MHVVLLCFLASRVLRVLEPYPVNNTRVKYPEGVFAILSSTRTTGNVEAGRAHVTSAWTFRFGS